MLGTSVMPTVCKRYKEVYIAYYEIFSRLWSKIRILNLAQVHANVSIIYIDSPSNEKCWRCSAFF